MGKCIFQDFRVSYGFKIYSTLTLMEDKPRTGNSQTWTLDSALSPAGHGDLAWPQVVKWMRWTGGPRRPSLEHYWVLWFIVRHFIIRVTLSFPKYSKNLNNLFLLNIFPHHNKDRSIKSCLLHRAAYILEMEHATLELKWLCKMYFHSSLAYVVKYASVLCSVHIQDGCLQDTVPC